MQDLCPSAWILTSKASLNSLPPSSPVVVAKFSTVGRRRGKTKHLLVVVMTEARARSKVNATISAYQERQCEKYSNPSH